MLEHCQSPARPVDCTRVHCQRHVPGSHEVCQRSRFHHLDLTSPQKKPHRSSAITSPKSAHLLKLQLGCRPVPAISSQPSDLFHLCLSKQRIILSSQLAEPSKMVFRINLPLKCRGVAWLPLCRGKQLSGSWDVNSISDRSNVSRHPRQPAT